MPLDPLSRHALCTLLHFAGQVHTGTPLFKIPDPPLTNIQAGEVCMARKSSCTLLGLSTIQFLVASSMKKQVIKNLDSGKACK